jgi:hypothetical protein
VLITNVAGDVVRATVKASYTGWMPMARNWGQNWQTSAILVGDALSFRVTASDRRTVTSWNVAGNGWHFGHTFQAKNNFRVIRKKKTTSGSEFSDHSVSIIINCVPVL